MIIEKISGGYVTLTWAGSATSSAFTLTPGSAAALSLPAGFTATSVTFEAEEPDGTWVGVNSGGTPLSVTVSVGKRNLLPETLFSAASTRLRAVLSNSNTGTGYLHIVK